MHNLMDENSSLRSLNMSLIYEREKLLRELRQCDSEMVSMQRSVDALLQTSSGKVETQGVLCQGFRWLCNKLVRKARTNAPDNHEIPAHLRQVLEACFDKYDEYQRQCQLHSDEDDCTALSLGGGMLFQPHAHASVCTQSTIVMLMFAAVGKVRGCRSHFSLP